EAESYLEQRDFKNYARLLTTNKKALPDTQTRAELNLFLEGHKDSITSIQVLNSDQEQLLKLDNAGLANSLGLTVPVVSKLRDESGNEVGSLRVELHAGKLIEEAVGPRYAALTPVSANAAQSAREVAVLSNQGTVLYAANPDWQGKDFHQSFPPATAAAFDGVLNGTLDNRDIYFIANQEWMIRRLNYQDKQHPERPELAVLVLEKYNGRDSLETIGNVMIGITFLLAIVATLLVYYFISGITDSIRRVTRGSKAIASGKLDYQIKVKSNDETGVLADAFNRMAARLREMIAREAEQKQFESFARLSAMLTHDLKNSILSLSFLVENMGRKFDREGFREDAMRTLADS
ncbi:MAG TPA: HAMP domain-containing protein, partial [Blastocatellia bacterium]|nr:HAMP domain-containing protein [Blastocatellia bacterium]